MQSPDGVILAQLGGPDTLDDVRPFLYNFFVDLIPDNIPVPAALVKPTAWLISSIRAPYSRRLYASIGGGSPLRAQTDAQAQALRDELRRRGSPMPVYVAMRNWRFLAKLGITGCRWFWVWALLGCARGRLQARYGRDLSRLC